MLNKIKTMNIFKSNISTKQRMLFIALGAALLTTGAVFAVNTDIFNSEKDSENPSSEQIKQEADINNSTKKDLVESTKDQDLPGTNPETPTSPDSISISTSINKGTVTVTVKLKGFSSGTCDLTLTRGSKVITKTADIIYQPDFSTCAGFTLLRDDLGAGDWSISLKATSANGIVVNNSSQLHLNE